MLKVPESPSLAIVEATDSEGKTATEDSSFELLLLSQALIIDASSKMMPVNIGFKIEANDGQACMPLTIVLISLADC